jgi:hypothetical protein
VIVARALCLVAVFAAGCATEQSARQPSPTMVSVSAEVGVSAGFELSAGDRPIQRRPRWWIAEPRVFERGDGWTLPLVIDLGGAPPPDHPVTYRVDASMQVAFERVDQEGEARPNDLPVMRAVPVEGEHLLSIAQDVCFQSSSTSNGRYRVGVRLERSAGFRPGDYQVTLWQADGSSLGGPHQIALH